MSNNIYAVYNVGFILDIQYKSIDYRWRGEYWHSVIRERFRLC